MAFGLKKLEYWPYRTA